MAMHDSVLKKVKIGWLESKLSQECAMKDCLPLSFLTAFIEARIEEVGAFTSSLLLVCSCGFKQESPQS